MSGSIFDVRCSVYHDVKDRIGQYVDPASGKVMRSISLGDFLFGGFWQDEVEEYRARLNEFARAEGLLAAKAEPRVKELKKKLPAATLSGYFEQGRRMDLLTAHTGFIALDIDYQDNTSLSEDGIKMCLMDRPETAAIIKSCSGSGFFVMVRLAHPEKHGEQFDALVSDYARMGIFLDKGCRDITRLRFASFDMEPYVNECAIPYQGVKESLSHGLLEQRHYINAVRGSQNVQTRMQAIHLVDELVKKVVATGTDIVPHYDEWYKCAFALSRIDPSNPEQGSSWFHAVSRVNGSEYNQKACERLYRYCLSKPSGSIGLNYFLALCDRFGIRIHERRNP